MMLTWLRMRIRARRRLGRLEDVLSPRLLRDIGLEGQRRRLEETQASVWRIL